MASEHFVIDGICHPYNFSEDNLVGRFGRIFNDILYGFHPLINPPNTVMSKDEWQHDWQTDEFVETMFLESDTDMVCVHSTPIFDAYKDGLVSIEKGAELKRRYPDRTIWYATADILLGEQALQSLEYQITELGADGIKLYPAQYYRGRTRYWRMDDYTVAFPVFELAQELGVRNIAVHKAQPLGPIATDAMRVDDIGHAAGAFPDLNFQVVHAGFMFLDECKFLLLNYPNVYATLEGTILFCQFDPQKWTHVLGELLLYGGPDKLIYSSAATIAHPRYLLDSFANFQMPDDFQVPLTDEVRAKILAENFARLHGIDVEAQRSKLANDEFAQQRSSDGLREPWSTVRGKVAA
jgi:predicted TIM-barrel fold metal-dependent hydrolase